MNATKLKDVLIKLVNSNHAAPAVGGSLAGGAVGGAYGGLSEKSDGESRLARMLKYMGLGSVTGAGAGIGGGMAGASLGKSYGPQVRYLLSGRQRRDYTGGGAVNDRHIARIKKRRGVARGQNAFTGAMTGAGLAGAGAAAGTSALADKYGSAYVQGLMDKCADYGIDSEQLVLKYAQNAGTGPTADGTGPISTGQGKAERAQNAKDIQAMQAEQKKQEATAAKTNPALLRSAGQGLK